MAQGPETRLVNRIREAIESVYPGAYVRKIHGGPFQTAGMPDLIACIDSVFVGVEVKASRAGESKEHALGRVTALQNEELRKIRDAGGISGIATSVEEALLLCEIAAGIGRLSHL